MIDVEDLKLGKQAYQFDRRTAKIADFLAPAAFSVPNVYDLDKGRVKMPIGLWGNDKWGDCVLVARGNQLVRLERLDTRHSVPLNESMVVNTYKEMTGSVSPGDANDNGLVMLEAMKLWRTGWKLPVTKKGHTYSIYAFGELESGHNELRAACYLLGGVQFGISLPLSAADQLRAGHAWDVPPGGPVGRGAPGSWGGHAVYSKRYDSGGFYDLTWGIEHYMTDRFIETYADEAWAVVDTLTGKHHLDQGKLNDYLTRLTG